MSGPQDSAQRAIAFQLVSALESYDQKAQELTETWLDMDLYQDVSHLVDEIRRYCASLPQFSVPWVGFLIAHTELMHALWKNGKGLPQTPPVDEVLAIHRVRHRDLHRKALQMLMRRTGPATFRVLGG